MASRMWSNGLGVPSPNILYPSTTSASSSAGPAAGHVSDPVLAWRVMSDCQCDASRRPTCQQGGGCVGCSELVLHSSKRGRPHLHNPTLERLLPQQAEDDGQRCSGGLPRARWISMLLSEWLRKQCNHPSQGLTARPATRIVGTAVQSAVLQTLPIRHQSPRPWTIASSLLPVLRLLGMRLLLLLRACGGCCCCCCGGGCCCWVFRFHAHCARTDLIWQHRQPVLAKKFVWHSRCRPAALAACRARAHAARHCYGGDPRRRVSRVCESDLLIYY